jgi:hypothetical protein
VPFPLDVAIFTQLTPSDKCEPLQIETGRFLKREKIA